MLFLSVLIGLAQAAAATPAPPAAAAADAASGKVRAGEAFSRLERMAGTWRPADKPDSPLRIRFFTTARGTVLVESWEVRGQPHSLTLYHRDGAQLIATHYCPQGNQPRLALTGGAGDRLHFAFRDATDLDPAESHQHELWFDLADPDRPIRGETYSSRGEPGAPERLALVREGEG